MPEFIHGPEKLAFFGAGFGVSRRLECLARALKQSDQRDLRFFKKVILEIKTAGRLTDKHRAPVHNHPKAAGRCFGLPVNFGRFSLVEHGAGVR